MLKQKQRTPIVQEPTPQIPRSEWKKHPKFESQALLLGSHKNFRDISQFIIDMVSQEDRISYAQRIFSSWMMGMRGHEQYEENKLFPYLSRRFSVSLEPLEEGHESLHDKEDNVRNAFQERLNSHNNTQAANDRLLKALQDHRDTLWEHLHLEEDTVIPLLLSMSSEEFNEYYNHGIRYLMYKLDERQKTFRPG